MKIFETFLKPEDEERVVYRIQALERASTGELRVHLARKSSRQGVMVDARSTFQSLGMTKTAARNGVLLYIAVSDRQFAIVGDEGIHAKVGQQGWEHAARKLEEHFKLGRFCDGILAALDEVGAVLTREFPSTPGTLNANELPDGVSRD